MWAKVEGRYYFSKIPAFQNIRNKKNLIFEIPFNASDKEVTEVIVEVEMLSEGNLLISGLSVQNGKHSALQRTVGERGQQLQILNER